MAVAPSESGRSAAWPLLSGAAYLALVTAPGFAEQRHDDQNQEHHVDHEEDQDDELDEHVDDDDDDDDDE